MVLGRADDTSQGVDHLLCLTLVMPRNAVQATPRTVLAIKVPRVPEERVLPKQTVKIHPVVGIFEICCALVMPRKAVQATPRTVLAIKVPRVPEERVLPKQTVKIHPVVGIFGFLEFKGERFQRSLELIEGPLRTASTAFLN